MHTESVLFAYQGNNESFEYRNSQQNPFLMYTRATSREGTLPFGVRHTHKYFRCLSGQRNAVMVQVQRYRLLPAEHAQNMVHTTSGDLLRMEGRP